MNSFYASPLLKVSLVLLLTWNASTVWGQSHPKTALKKAPAHAGHAVSTPALPKAALSELSRVLLNQCADGGNDYIRAFVYRAYMSAGARYRYEVDEQLGKISTSKRSRDTILAAINARSNGEKADIMDNLYSALGMSMANAKVLSQFIVQNYHLPKPEPTPEAEPEGEGTPN